MKLAIVICPFVFLLSTSDISAQTRLQGTKGSSPQWKAGWINLQHVMDFRRGDTLEIRVGGTATQVILRLLSVDADPNSSDGIVGGIQNIPSNHIIKVILDADYKNIKQISVHGGPSPWGEFDLNPGNGPATIGWITLLKS